VVIQQGVQQIGVLVDKVPEIRDVRPMNMLRLRRSRQKGPTRFVTGILKLAGRMGSLVEVPALLSYVGGTK